MSVSDGAAAAGPRRILFVCTGNICRSPMAEAVMRRLLERAGIEGAFVLDSAGTSGWHVGAPPEPLAIEVAAARDYDVHHPARQVTLHDLEQFDLVIAMDRGHLRRLLEMSLDVELRSKVRLFIIDADVPDPYGGPRSAFERALDVIERGCHELFAELMPAAG